MIEFINITKKFRNNFWEKDFHALTSVSFKINQGDLVGFLGANGAGKTTLIKCLMDFSRQDSGEIKFDKNILGSSLVEIKSQMGYLPERAYLYQHLTGREFLIYTGNLCKVEKNVLNQLIKFWSEKIQIDFALDRQIRSYSKGMQQRLGFISTLIHKPKFLILDEPLSGLDPIGRRDFKKILKELNLSGTTIFFSSHIVSDVEEICNKIVFIERGKLIYEGGINELIYSNSNDHYEINYIENNEMKTLVVKEHQKDSAMRDMIEKGFNIISLEKNNISLEEIIYKIQK